MNTLRPYFRLRRLSPGVVRCACAFVLISFASARAAEPLVIESALLRLTQQIDVPARAQGQLASMSVAEGDKVQQGTPLAQIDDAEAQLQQKRAALELDLQKVKVNNDVAI